MPITIYVGGNAKNFTVKNFAQVMRILHYAFNLGLGAEVQTVRGVYSLNDSRQIVKVSAF